MTQRVTNQTGAEGDNGMKGGDTYLNDSACLKTPVPLFRKCAWHEKSAEHNLVVRGPTRSRNTGSPAALSGTGW